jgi:hypothetical protein
MGEARIIDLTREGIETEFLDTGGRIGEIGI